MTGRLETFLVRPTESAPADANERIADHVTLTGGLVLMSTGGGSLIVALTREAKDSLAQSPLVGLIGGVTLNETAPGARALRQHFAENVERQIGRIPTSLPTPPVPSPRRPA
jgi:hypothetical protein